MSPNEKNRGSSGLVFSFSVAGAASNHLPSSYQPGGLGFEHKCKSACSEPPLLRRWLGHSAICVGCEKGQRQGRIRS